MRIRELIYEDNPTIADVIKTAAQPTTQKPGSSQTPTQPGNQPTTTTSTPSTGLNKDAQGNKINYQSSVANKKNITDPNNQSSVGNQQQDVDLTKIPPAQIQQHLRPGTQVNLGQLGKIKVGQVTANGVEFDGTNTPIGSKFTIDFKKLQQTPQ
jgi:hypothetical protein